ncbi:hypothetical protein [Clostridium thailandense]|uniref:hypothetical protein n=1 Tax=Clostridium thailandense TaxID=2794346 RepID=UPI0039897B15
MNEDKSKIEWDSLVYHIEFNLDKKVHYDTEYSKNLIRHCSINNLLRDYNDELLKHDVDYWVNLIYGEREFIYKYLEVYRRLKDFYSIPENIIEYLKINYFNKNYKQKLISASLKNITDEVLIKYYGATDIHIYKIGTKTNDVIQEFTINYIKARNPVEARLEAEKEYGFSEKINDLSFSGDPIHVFVEQILDVNLEYKRISEIKTDIEAFILRKKRLQEKLEDLMLEN